MNIRNALHKLDNKTNGIVKFVYISTMKTVYYLPLKIIRHRVIKAVGRDKYEIVKNTKTTFFPNHISQAEFIIQRGYALRKILLTCQIKPTPFDPATKSSLIFNWQDLTKDEIDSREYTTISYKQANTETKNITYLNHHLNDISKKNVGEIQLSCFSHPLDINPTKHIGLAVKKSNGNFTHDGTVINCPISSNDIDDACVYSLLVNNVIDNFAIDFRLIYIDGILEFFYEKRRPICSRFSNLNDTVRVRKTNHEFSKHEIELIESFCQRIGADYGELDVLRDQDTKKIYVVDFSKTPGGPAKELSKRESFKAIELMSIAYIHALAGSSERLHD